MDPSDFELLEQWRGGDGSAGNELVARHYTTVRRFLEVRLTHAAEDLTQRVFLDCIQQIERRAVHTSFRAYLLGIARNHMLMHLRSSSRHDRMRSFADEEADRPSRKTSLTAIYARMQQHHLLLRAMVELPPDLQIALQLYYWDGLSTPEIGEVLEIPASTVTTRLARARELLKRELVRVCPAGPERDSLVRDLSEWTRSLIVPDGPTPGAR
ncbi:MAG TPA: sigma-70 family RNA polymerase sigma factor [Nannocystaceae bacterium]|nr:sigma-70 family RNA polymerase sigma factor [Nannocystaceae bacterium]